MRRILERDPDDHPDRQVAVHWHGEPTVDASSCHMGVFQVRIGFGGKPVPWGMETPVLDHSDTPPPGAPKETPEMVLWRLDADSGRKVELWRVRTSRKRIDIPECEPYLHEGWYEVAWRGRSLTFHIPRRPGLSLQFREDGDEGIAAAWVGEQTDLAACSDA